QKSLVQQVMKRPSRLESISPQPVNGDIKFYSNMIDHANTADAKLDSSQTSTSIATLVKPPTSPSIVRFADEHPSIPTLLSPLDDFRTFQKSIPHPAVVLKILPREATQEDPQGEINPAKTQNISPETGISRIVPAQHDDANAFNSLCEEVLATVGDLEASLEEMTIWKDGFLKTTVPSGVKLQLTLLFARVFRSKSDLHEPLFELIKQVRMYSKPWIEKQVALMELEKDYKRQTQVLDVAIRKLEYLHMQLIKTKAERRVHFWSRLTKRLLEFTHTTEQNRLDSEIMAIENLRKETEQNEELPIGNPISEIGQLRRIGEIDHIKVTQANHPDMRNMRNDIKSYISQMQPSWKKHRNTLSKQFRRIVRFHFPNITKLLTRAHRHPFSSQAHLIYPSMYNNTFRIAPRRSLHGLLRRTWSQLELNNLYPIHMQISDNATEDLLYQEFNEGLHERMNEKTQYKGESTQSEKEQVVREGKWPAKFMRSNSFNAVWELANSRRIATYQLDAPLEWPVTWGGQGKPRIKSHPLNKDAIDDAIFGKFLDLEDGRDEDEVEEDNGSSVDDIPSFVYELENGRRVQEEELDINERDQFSLKEVMELTLLHAQQMQLLHHEYEIKNQELVDKIEQLENHQKDMQTTWELKIQNANERAQRLAADYRAQEESAANATAALIAAVRAATVEENKENDLVEDEENEEASYLKRTHWSRRQ
ncbi:hypothetical protein HK096_005102, partial [Nowakowskiella sp. JEL0078]